MHATLYELAMDVAAATELAVWILGPAGMTALVLWLGRNKNEVARVSPDSAVSRLEPGWTEAMFTDGTYSYGRAFSVNDALIDPEAMTRIRETYVPAIG